MLCLAAQSWGSKHICRFFVVVVVPLATLSAPVKICWGTEKGYTIGFGGAWVLPMWPVALQGVPVAQ